MDFLKAVYSHFRDSGLYDMDWIDWVAWIAFMLFVLYLEVE
jgi:hypothetical protein